MNRAYAYLHAKFHLDPSNRLATVHERYRQDTQTDRHTDKQTDNGLIGWGEPFYKRSPRKTTNDSEELSHRIETKCRFAHIFIII